MVPSRPVVRLPGFQDPDKEDASHDAYSGWLLRAAATPGAPERLLALSRPQMAKHRHKFVGVELEALLWNEAGEVKGFTDGLLKFTEGVRLWVEIKTDDKAIGALVRQVKLYRSFIKGDSENWLAILPCASTGAKEFLAHAGIGTHIVDPTKIPSDLYSVSASREGVDSFDPIPGWSSAAEKH